MEVRDGDKWKLRSKDTLISLRKGGNDSLSMESLLLLILVDFGFLPYCLLDKRFLENSGLFCCNNTLKTSSEEKCILDRPFGWGASDISTVLSFGLLKYGRQQQRLPFDKFSHLFLEVHVQACSRINVSLSLQGVEVRLFM